MRSRWSWVQTEQALAMRVTVPVESAGVQVPVVSGPSS